ncbi:hypothetical protein [Kerstersia sp.]|uniref:hypothetical protein n=1 Tax=Kerstersia sp. TaxID=1930783 RepID=UPI003F92785D
MLGIMSRKVFWAGSMAAVLSGMPLAASAQAPAEELCETVALLSRSTMHVRQHGVSLENLLAAHAADGKNYGGQIELVQAIARDAYAMPAVEDEAAKSQAVEAFGEKWRKLCLTPDGQEQP